MEQKIRLISLDLATKKSGLAYFENNKYQESHVVDYEKIKDIDERTVLMGKRLIKALDYYKPTVVYSEDSFKGQNPKTMKCLCKLHGIIMGWCLIHDVEYHFLMPSTWRKYIPDFPNGRNAKRDEQKLFSVQYVMDIYNIKPISDDESDAILIGEAAIRMNSKK